MTGLPNGTKKRRSISWTPAKCFAVCLTLFLLALGIRCFRVYRAQLARTQPHWLDSFAMGSYVDQTVWGADGEQAAAGVSAALADLENRVSWRREGEIAQLNAMAGEEPVQMSEETLALLDEMLELCEKSGGALDITLGPVTRLWDFDSNPRLPDGRELEEALALVDYRKLLTGEDAFWEFLPSAKELFCGRPAEDCAALLEPGMAVDLGAIGKGAACDVALARYQEAGMTAAVVAVGGSIGLYGQKPDGKPFRVSVRDPAGAGGMGVLELPGGFVSTSGSYEKFFELGGETYCHLLDPRTGYPAKSGLVSVTVWCPPDVEQSSGALSDGLATACFLLGLEKSLPLLGEYRAQAIFVDENGQVTVTEGLRERFELTSDSYTLIGP